ncbi:MAG: UbiD family decarboxylase [Nitrososphaerales archaeon]
MPKNKEVADIRSFLKALEKKGELLRVRKKVSLKYELAGLEQRLDGGPALFFESVEGSNMSVVSGLCGSRERVGLALSANFESIHERYAQAQSGENPRVTRDGPVLESIGDAHLSKLPVPLHYEKDAGHYITSSIIFARNPGKRYQNGSVHRLRVLDDNRLVVRAVEGRHLDSCIQAARIKGTDLDVAIVIGVHPAILLASAYQAPLGIDEMKIAGGLLGTSIPMVKCPGSDLLVPSHAELVLLGKLLPDQLEEEYMAEMLATYDYKRLQPIIKVDKILQRKDAIYHDILAASNEHRFIMSVPVESKVMAGVRSSVPSVEEVRLTEGGCNWLVAVIKIKKKHGEEPKNAISAAFAAHPSLKIVFVVDHDIDITDPSALEFSLATRFQADGRLVVIQNAKGSSLDPSSNQAERITSKIGFDATATLSLPWERFETAKIPGAERLVLKDYLPKGTKVASSIKT